MGNFASELKKKGPGGIPLYIYAAGSVILLYFGYRWFKNRGSSGSSSSTDTSGTNGTDSSSGDAGGANGSDTTTPGSLDTSPPADSTLPSSTGETAPPADDSTGVINGPISIGVKLKQKVKKKGHASAHDHKQGTHGTKKRPLHRRKAGTTQTKHAHAPTGAKRVGSTEKKKTTANVKLPTASRSGELVKHGGAAPPPVHGPVTKKTPAPVPVEKSAPRVVAKAPPPAKRRSK